jgi:hypothetical protein
LAVDLARHCGEEEKERRRVRVVEAGAEGSLGGMVGGGGWLLCVPLLLRFVDAAGCLEELN